MRPENNQALTAAEPEMKSFGTGTCLPHVKTSRPLYREQETSEPPALNKFRAGVDKPQVEDAMQY